MLDRIRAYPMVLLLLPLVVVIFLCERIGVLYPEENVVYDSLLVHTFVLSSESKPTAQCERFEAETYGGKIYLYIQRDSTMPQKGDTLIAKTRIRHIESFDTFDYKKYLLRQGIVGSAYVYQYELHPTPTHRPSLQRRWYNRLQAAGLEGDELATVGALTLGYKEDLSRELKQHFQASGAAHVLAVSGLHTGIIYALLLGLLTLGGRIRPKYENQTGRCIIGSVIILVMWGYAWLTGMTPSVVRAVVMVSLFEIGRMCYRQALSLNTVASAAVLILLVRPLDLWSVSFQLSFAATTAIVVLAKRYERYAHRLMKKGFSGRIASWILGTLIISIAAQLGTLPLTMYYFNQISSYFLLTNLIVLPIASVLVPCGLVSLALGGTWIGVWFSKLTGALAWLMNHSVGWIESLPGSTIATSIGLPMVLIYYVWFILLCIFVSDK